MNPQPVRIHRPLVNEVLYCLQEIFEWRRPADKVIERAFKANPKFGKRDRSYIAENVYDITRNYELLSACVPGAKSFWEILAAWMVVNKKELPDWTEFGHISVSQIQKNLIALVKNPALKWSVPKDLDAYGKRVLNERWYTEIKAMHLPGPLVIRVNTLKAKVEQVIEALNAHQLKFHSIDSRHPTALVIDQRINLFPLPMFKKGWIEVQDYSSQLVGYFVDPRSGMRIVDACAGAGGKSLHLADLMGNKGRIISMDIEEYKLSNLKIRARRGGAGIIECRLIDNNKAIKRLEASADKVVLDVPCSGSGVLKRNPDAKYRITSSYVDQLVQKQQEILNDYCPMVKPKGELIYVTCSIFPDENEHQINTFLKNHPDFELVKVQQLWPSECGFDGFYMAKMRKLEPIK